MEALSKQEILNKLSELSKLTGLRLGLAGSYARGTNKKNSDIDIVVDANKLTIDIMEMLKKAFEPRKADVLITELLKDEDIELDNFLLSIGLSKNEDSVYKSIMREVIWIKAYKH